MWYLVNMTEIISLTFINYLMFTFEFADDLFWKFLLNVIFLDELFFLYMQQCDFGIDLQGDLNFIFTRQFSGQIIYLIQYVKGRPAKYTLQRGDQTASRRPLEAGRLLSSLPGKRSLTSRSRPFGIWRNPEWDLICWTVQRIFHGHFPTPKVVQLGGALEANIIQTVDNFSGPDKP